MDSTKSPSSNNLENNNNKNNSNNKHDINQKEKNTDVDNDGNSALHSKELLDLITGANFKSAKAKTDILRLLENMLKQKTSIETLGKDMKCNNRTINQRPKTNNQKKDDMSRRKFKQMATNFAELQFSSSFSDKMMQESEPTYSHFIGCLDGLSRNFQSNNTPNPDEDIGKTKARKIQKLLFWLPQDANKSEFAKYLWLCADDIDNGSNVNSKIYQDIDGIDPYHNAIYGKDAEGSLLTRINASVVAAGNEEKKNESGNKTAKKAAV